MQQLKGSKAEAMPVVVIKKHELEAMREIVINIRAIAPVIAPDTPYGTKLINLAQMIEDVVSRVETEKLAP
jgi:hypothetical protein